MRRVEDALMQDEKFHLPRKKALLENNNFSVVVGDATETPIERPKKKQRDFYSGKKKRHTLKTQVVADKKSRKIIATAHI